MITILHREVVKLSFMQFYEYYSSTIKKYAPELDETSMNVRYLVSFMFVIFCVHRILLV